MKGMYCCEVCGNDMNPGLSRCPFCREEIKAATIFQGEPHRVINLEQGMPLVKQALARLDTELAQAGLMGCRVLTLIHGYGSSGRGGKIRQEVRARLEYLKESRAINDILLGEDFSKHSGAGRQLLRRYPFLKQHGDLNRGNQGVTIVVLNKKETKKNL